MGDRKVKTFKSKVEVEFNPDAIEIAEAFWSMTDEEQCYFFEHLYELSHNKLPMQLQYIRDSEFFNVKVKCAMSLIGEYAE